MLDTRRSMPAVLDRHIDSEEQDAFGHRHYAHALRSLIENEDHRTPFSIGLLGGWGTGKSSIKELYTRALADDTSTAGGRYPRSQRFKSITFNAWRFGGKEQDIKRALLRHVFLELGGDESKLHDDLYRNVTHTENVTKSFGQLTKQHLVSWAAPVPAFAIVVVTYLLLVAAGLKWLPLTGGLIQSLFIAAVTGVYTYLIKAMKPTAVTPFNTITRVHLPNASAEQYEELLLQQLRKFKATKSNAIPYERLVIFVDDLDRLSAEEMVLGLDAVRTFMEIPSDKLPENLGMVFVISCDEGKVADALSRRRGNPEQPGSIFNSNDARRYLDRIFQFRLEIPPPPRNDMRQFALSKLKSFKDLEEDIADKGASLEQLVDRMIHVNVTDPRNALQIINAFTQTWWLAKQREREAIGSDRPGGLHEGAVSKYPVALGALSAARVSFPGFYQDLQAEPQLLARLTNLMVRQTSLMDEPVDSLHVLKRYVIQEEQSDKPSVTDGCRDLRQFLASLVGIRWPESLQSLLLLSEDSVTRQYGPHATRIYGYLVSGDTQGFLEALSPRASEELSDQEVRLVHNMLSELHRTEDTLKFNAMRVIADIIDRLPVRTKDLVMGFLCNDIVTSEQLRSMLGVEKIGRIVEAANPVDQQQIAAILIKELLTLGAVCTMSSPSGQVSNVHESTEMVANAARITLSVMNKHGLPPAAKDALMKWLPVREHIRMNAGVIKVDFAHLQLWVDEFETSLLPEIGADYINELIAELHQSEEDAHDEPEQFQGWDLPILATRINTVWDQLAAEGNESRQILWAQVTSLSTMAAPEMVDCVIRALQRYVPYSTDEQIVECLARFSVRVCDYKILPIDHKSAIRLLIDLGAERKALFVEEHLERYAQLAIALSAEEGEVEEAAEILRTFVIPDQDAMGIVLDSWVNESLGRIPSACRNLLFEAYESLAVDDQVSLVGQLNLLIERKDLDEVDEALYTDAAIHIPEHCWSDKHLRPHLDRLVTSAPGSLVNWKSLRHLMPGFSRVFINATPTTVGPALQKLFSAAKSHTEAFDTLHSYFRGKWPTVEQLPHGYAPQTLFTEAKNLATSTPGAVRRCTLASMHSMLTEGVVAASLQVQLIEAACAVWHFRAAEAVDFLSSGGVSLSIGQLAQLADSVDFKKEEQVAMLQRAWSALISELPTGEYVDAGKAVLHKGPLGNLNELDLAFTTWCRALQIEAFDNIKSMLTESGATDEQRKRLFGHIVHYVRDEKEFDELKALTLQLLKLQDSPLTWGAVNNLRYTISKRFATYDEKLEFARILLRELPNAASDTAKNHMAVWARDLGSDSLLKEIAPENISESDIDIIRSAFGTSRQMSGLFRRWKNRN